MNGDGYMLYDFGALDELGSSIDTRVSTIHNLVEDLRSQVNNLSSQYSGAASEGFQQTRNNWNNAANDLNAVLAKISIAVKKTREDAHATERTTRVRAIDVGADDEGGIGDGVAAALDEEDARAHHDHDRA